MAKVTGLTLEQAKAERKRLIASGKELSTSKELGKLEDYIKTLQPNKYDSATVASAQKKLSTSTQVPGSAGGASSLSGFNAGQPATIDLNKIYENELNSPELRALQDELNAKKTARDTAEADINDNPYYAEATRVGKITKLNERANNEISTLQSQVEQRKADALVKVNIATQQYNIEDKAYQNNINKLNTLISSGAIAGATSTDIGQIAVATGMSTEMVRAIADNVKRGQIQTTVRADTDDNGNVTVSVINSQTGEVVAQNSLGGIGNKQNTSGTTTDDKQMKAFDSAVADGIAQLKQGEDWGTVWNRLYTKFKGIGSDEDLILAIDSGLGTQWRSSGAYESYKLKQTGGQ